ncbi:MAG: hypothetical protein M3Z27_07605, partial [Actinomycetota bacterium]|nr:hypothetical protein [Actinomycetota bacterium]
MTCVLVMLAGAATAHASSTPVGTGDLPSAVTDRDGTTHVVWLEANAGNTADTVTYCQIPRGSVTCASTQHLVPKCGDGTTLAPSRHRLAGGNLDGDGPKVSVSPFGDVYVVTHGTCPIDWNTSIDPWHSEHGIDREVVFHSTDAGATFAVEGGEARARGSRQSASYADPSDTSTSSTVYDAADTRLVTAMIPDSSGYHCCDGVDTGVYVLGRQDRLIVQDPSPPSTAEMQKGLLAPTYIGNQAHLQGGAPSLVQRARGSFAVAYAGYGSNGGGTVFIRTFDCAACALNAISDAANWGPEIAFPAEDGSSAMQAGPRSPQLVSGPAGTFVLYEDDSFNGPNGSTIHQFWIRKLDGNTLGPRHLVISRPSEANHQGPTGQLVEDGATGRLHVIYTTHPQSAQVATTEYVASDDAGASWASPVQLGTLPAVQSSNYFSEGTEALSLSTGDQGFTGLVVRSGLPTTDNSGHEARGIYVDALPGSGQGGGG